MKQAALIELYDYHIESIYSQVKFLKSAGYKVHVLCSYRALHQLSDFTQADAVYPFRMEWGFLKALYFNTLSFFFIRNYLARNKIETVVIHTAHGRRVLLLLQILGKSSLQIFGVLHSISDLQSRVHKLIEKYIRHFFVLNDELLNNISSTSSSFSSFYAVYFPEFRKTELNKGNAIWITIPGKVELNRRDYDGLLNQLAAHRALLPPDLRFILLGRCSGEDGELIREKIKALNLSSFFLVFEDFIPNDIFYSYITNSDLLMPLLHADHPSFDSYLVSKISGTLNLAVGYEVPMLMEDSLSSHEDFAATSIFYEKGKLAEMVVALSKDRQLLMEKAMKYRQNPKWDFSYQKEKYLSAIEASTEPSFAL